MTKLTWQYRLMIVILAFAAYAPTLRTGFMWDDHVMIEANPRLQHWSAANLRADFSSDVFEHTGDAYYRPIQTLLNRLDYSFWGLRPLGYHLTNFLIHAGNGLLIVELILVLGFSPLMALLAGCLFVVNPLVVEQLMIIAGRAELLGLFFSLLTILCLLKEGAIGTLLACGAYIGALLSKESAVVTPVLAGLTFYLRQEKTRRYLVLAPLIVITLAYAWLRQKMVGPLPYPMDLSLLGFFYLKAFPNVLTHYIAITLVPWNLHSHHMMPHLSHAWPVYLILWSALLVGTWMRNRRLIFFATAWFIVCFLPKTPVMMYGHFILDHWGYPACFAICLLLAAGVEKGWQGHQLWIKNAVGIGYLATLIVWALLVHLNVALRGTDEKMYRWALHFTTSNPIKYNLGTLLLNRDRPGDAMEAVGLFEDVHQAYPDDLKTSNAVALAYWQSGQHALGLRIVEQLAKDNPKDAETQRNLAEMRKRIPSH